VPVSAPITPSVASAPTIAAGTRGAPGVEVEPLTPTAAMPVAPASTPAVAAAPAMVSGGAPLPAVTGRPTVTALPRAGTGGLGAFDSGSSPWSVVGFLALAGAMLAAGMVRGRPKRVRLGPPTAPAAPVESRTEPYRIAGRIFVATVALTALGVTLLYVLRWAN
jgi:hypothetical protein